jgi:hypothetical protein
VFTFCRERALEAKVDKVAEMEANHSVSNTDVVSGNTDGGITFVDATAKGISGSSIESVKGGEMLMQALDLAESEMPNFAYIRDDSAPENKSKVHHNPLLLGLTPCMYFLRALRSIKAPDFEQALMILPFYYVGRLITMLIMVRPWYFVIAFEISIFF